MKDAIKRIHDIQQKLLNDGVVFYPELPEVLIGQLRRVLKGEKDCMLWHKINYPALPDLVVDIIFSANLSVLNTTEGVFCYNPTKLNKHTINRVIKLGQIGHLLGYGISGVPEIVEDTFALRLIDVSGLEKEAVSCTREQLPAVFNALMKFYKKGDRFEVQNRDEFRKERLSRFNV